MELPRLCCKCECGQVVQPHILALTPLRQLLIIGYCLACNDPVQITYRLQDLIRHCPKPEVSVKQLSEAIDQAIQEVTGKDKFDELSEADIIRLHGMMVKEEVCSGYFL